MKISEIKNQLLTGVYDEKLQMLSCKTDVSDLKRRYEKLLDDAIVKFGDLENASFFSVRPVSGLGA